MIYDFCGYVTKYGVKCSDGRTIRRSAFKHCDGLTVPLVWQHLHDSPKNILGHAVLEERPDGVYAYCRFNDSPDAKRAKVSVAHKDITKMSIWANQIMEQSKNVIHGVICEVSLVLKGANPGAMIENISFAHGDTDIISEEDVIIHSGCDFDYEDDYEDDANLDDIVHADGTSEDYIEDVLNSMNKDQKKVLDLLVAAALEDDTEDNESNDDSEKDDKKEDENMAHSHNLFDSMDDRVNKDKHVLSHSDTVAIIQDADSCGSMKKSALQHGITDIEYLFPEAKTETNQPDVISREHTWVTKVLSMVRHSPFSRIKTIHADITEDEARARGYIKGDEKVDEVFSLLKRITTPTTVYKHQGFDRDDLIDITDMDAVGFIKWEMRYMLDEELARAYLIGDGRSVSDRFKINEQNIRPIYTDDDLFTVKCSTDVLSTASGDDRARAFIRTIVKNRKKYKGAGSPVLFTTEDMLSDCLLLTDTTGRDIYTDVEQLCKKLRVHEIIPVPVFDDVTRTDTKSGKKFELMGLLVNMSDYRVGADKGGAVNMFDDFDIDYNKQKYLIETRCSGALTKAFSALAIEAPIASGSGTAG